MDVVPYPRVFYWARAVAAARAIGLIDLDFVMLIGHDPGYQWRLATLHDACWIAHDYLGRLAVGWVMSPSIRKHIETGNLRAITEIRKTLQAAHRRRDWIGDWLLV